MDKNRLDTMYKNSFRSTADYAKQKPIGKKFIFIFEY